MSAEEENLPAPNWLLKLEENRERRVKGKLGHEAGAGAKCQKCEDKCPGLDLHFWRKICKACKCGKEDHDIVDDDIYGYVQFQLLGSKPVKSKGVFLKGRKDEVILEWTPKGSSNDIKKYLDELPVEMIPVKGSEGAKIRKQRLQKQMPAHDIDSSLCHQLTEDEIKEMEEYVSHIRKNCVGQGKIIRLSLFKGNQHKITPANPQFMSQIPPAQIASSQTVFLHSSDISNNLHNLSLRDKAKNVPQNQGDPIPPLTNDPMGKQSQKTNFNPQNIQQNIIDNQNPATVGINDINYYPSGPQIVHPLTTSNVERHQEQFEIQNANFDRILNPNLNYAPNYLNPVEQHQLPAQVGQPKDLKYPTSQKSQLGDSKPIQNANVNAVTGNPLAQYNASYVNPVDLNQIPAQVGQPKDLKYPIGTPQKSQMGDKSIQNANINTVTGNPLAQYNPNYVNPVDLNQIPTQVGQPKDINYPIGSFDNQNVPRFNNANIDSINNPLMQYNPNYINPIDQTQLPTLVGQPKDLKYPNTLGTNSSSTENLNYPPPINNSTHPLMQRNPQGSQPQDLKYPQEQLNPIYPIINNANIPLQQYNPNFVNPIENIQLPAPVGQPKDMRYPSGEGIGQKYSIGQYPADQLAQINADNANPVGPIGQYSTGDQIGANPDMRYPVREGINADNSNAVGQIGQYPTGQTNIGINQDVYPVNPSDIKNKPLIPILEAQNLINPFETHQNLQSVGYIRDIDYPTETMAQNQVNLEKPDQNLNQPPPKCFHCKETFEDGSVAISADRTTNLWHSKCFNCHSCKQPLADLLYFYHKDSDNIYCGRDYAILKGIPRCLACDELIFVREYCLAEDNTFHIKHFCCYECDTPLAGNQYIMECNQPVCISCENLKAEICNDCRNKIRPDQQGVSLQNLHWHATGQCFACKKCRKALLGGKMLLRNQNLFCSDVCFKSF